MSSHYLFELGTEELPPKSLLQLSTALSNSIKQSLARHKLNFDKFESFASPRRLAFLAHGLDDQTPKSEVKNWGPPAKIAFDADGNPTKAALAFCQRNGIDAKDIQVESDGKAEKICCLKSEGGDDTSTLLPEFIASALQALPIAKRMRWGSNRTEFVRPVHWLVLMKDTEVIPAELLTLKSGNTTRGHRFLSNSTIQIRHASSYSEQLLKDGKVLADFESRRTSIAKQVAQEATTLGGTAVIGNDLLNEVCALVEWPVAVSGQFDQAFLEVPSEALISSMREHQKYFHVVDDNKQLMPAFITVSNIEASDYSAIKSGNEKVIRPRLADAAFFFETDKKQSLEARREKLKSVVFQTKLGSVFDKTERVKHLAAYITNELSTSTPVDINDVCRCAELCKSDLVSNMVYEFPEMQGIAGYHYALNDNENEHVATGIVEHYMPKFAGDELPRTDVAAIVALADRIDTLTGIFGIGLKPTGSKDPFALRRASVSTLRILVEKQYALDLRSLLTHAAKQHAELSNAGSVVDDTLSYILERFKGWYEEANIAAEVFQAVNAKGLSEPLDIHHRITAVNAFYSSEDAIALAAANKRVANILAKVEGDISESVNQSLFSEDAESQLYSAVNDMSDVVTPLIKSRDYKAALSSLSGLRHVVDQFFDQVMVMADDEAVKNNRIAVLNQLRSLFLNIADIRFLAPGK